MKNLVILAGGKSIRMGKDKAFLHISDETFIERLYVSGRKLFDRVLISTDTKEHAALIVSVLPPEEQSKIEIITDRYPDRGPLGALCTIFEETDLDIFAVVPVDVPNASMDFLLEQYEKLEDAAAGKEKTKAKPIIIAESESEKYEPLIGVYSREAYSVLKDALNRNDNKVIRVIAGCYEAVKLNGELKNAFRNVNTKTDYKELIQ